jgi:sugar phosphate isomerase/epimerase
MPCGVSAFSFAYLTGGLGRGTGRANPRPLDIFGLMDLAAAAGLSGVEFPPGMVPDPSADGLTRLRNELRARRLTPVLDGGSVLNPVLPDSVRAAHALGCRTLRVVLSSILCGDRSPMAGRWQEHLDKAACALREVEPLARELAVAVAVENHQDATSDDLVWLCQQVGSPAVGVNLDAGNPLAVGECPVEFARRVAPYLKNVHLKDYLMYRTPAGYRLVRCALGEGVLDWRALFDLFDAEAPQATRNIELGAMQDRHIRLFEAAWWEHYPARDVRTLLSPLRLLADMGQPADAEYRVPWERGEPPEAQEAYEREQFHRSVEFLRTILARKAHEAARL